jgi:hypothetical protein
MTISVLPVIAAVSVVWEDDQLTADFADCRIEKVEIDL